MPKTLESCSVTCSNNLRGCRNPILNEVRLRWGSSLSINGMSEAELKSAIVRHPLMVTADTSVTEVIAQMSGVRGVCSVAQTTDNQQDQLQIEARSSCVLVVENNQPVGIFTERDVVRLSAQKRDLANLAIGDVMNHPVVTLRESQFNDLFFAINLLQHHHIRHLPVVDDQNQLVGMLTHESLRQTSRPADFLQLRLVNEVMTTKVICAVADVSILAIARLMAENRVSSVMIVQTRVSLTIPVGILTERDIVQFQALNLNFDTYTAADVMSTPVFCVNAGESLLAVQEIMKRQLIQRLAVTGKEGELLGIVTQTSILQVINPLELYKITTILEKKVSQLEAEKIELLENRNVELVQQVDERTIALRKKVEQEQLITKVATQIRSSLDIEEILNTTVAEIRLLLQCDRVIIYKFRPDFSGRVIAESILAGGISVLHTEPHDPCITPEYLESYLQGQIRVINDIHLESMTQCHQEMLIGFDIRSKLMVPIIVENKIWGLMLTSYRDIPHHWELEEIQLVRQLSIQVAIAIKQANIYEQVQIELKQKQQAEELIKQQITELTIWKNRYELASRATGQIIYEYSLINNALTSSTNMEKILGYSCSEAPRTLAELLNFVHPEDRDRLDSSREKHLAQRGLFATEYRMRCQNGNYIWIEDRNEFVLNQQGEIVAVIGTLADISDRKQAEQNLYALVKESERLEEQLYLVMKGTNDGWWDYDILNNSIYYSSRWLSMLGYKDGEVDTTIQTVDSLMHPEDLDRIHTIMNQALSDKNIELIKFDFRLRHKQGHYIPINSRNYILRDETGQAVRVSGANTDMTELLEKDQQLQATLNKLYQINQELEARVQQRTAELFNLSNRLELAVKSAKIGIWDWDLVNDHMIWDNQMYEIYGVKASEFSGAVDAWERGLHPEDAVHTHEWLWQAIRGERDFDPEFRIVLPDGKVRIIQAYATVQRNSQGEGQRIIGVNIDVTQRKQAEQKIKQQAEREYLLRETTQRIRQSLNLTAIFNTAVEEIRQLINVDRVGIFKFDPDSNFNDGEFVSESVVVGFKSALAAKIHDHCFGDQYAIYYQQGRIQVVDNIDNAGLLDCHHDVLAQFQIRANLVVPLLQGKNLWGLLCIHQCSAPRHWETFEIELVQQIAEQLAIAIQQSSLYEQVQSELIIRKQAEKQIFRQLQQQKIIQEITQEIRSSLDLTKILATVTQKVQELIQADRVIVFRLFDDGKSQIVEEVVINGYVALKDRHWEDEIWSQDILDCYWQGQPRIVPDVINDIWTDCLLAYCLEGQIQSKIVAPILQDLAGNETGRWVNHPHNKLWGILVVHACSTKRIWEESAAQVLQQIANQLAIAIQQSDLFYKLQTSLENEKEVSQMRSRFISMVSHEFRTPLAIISSSTDILQNYSDRLTSENKQEHLEVIQKTINHTVQLLDDVLMINRAESEKMEFKPEALDIIDFCRRLKTEIAATSSKHTIEFSVNTSEPTLNDILVVQFDPKLIRQILTNLLSNAMKYSPENSSVNFRLNIENDQLIFEIQDSGIGIPEKDQTNLFGSFYRASNVSNISGTGLGLAIVKKCVDQHQGEITLDSEVQQGTTFTFRIPLSK